MGIGCIGEATGEGTSNLILGLRSSSSGEWVYRRRGAIGLSSPSEEASEETLPRRAWRGWLCRRFLSSTGGERRSAGEVPPLGDVMGEELRFSGNERLRDRERRGDSASGARNWVERWAGEWESGGRTGRLVLVLETWA